MSQLRRVTNKHFMFFIALIVTFGVIAWFAPFFLLYEILSGLAIGVGLAVIILYVPVAFESFTVKHMSAGQQLAAGICITWVGTLCNRAYNLVWRVRYPDAELFLINSDFVNLTIFLIILGGILHTTVPDLKTGTIKKRNWIFLIVAICFGALTAGVIIGLGVGLSI